RVCLRGQSRDTTSRAGGTVTATVEVSTPGTTQPAPQQPAATLRKHALPHAAIGALVIAAAATRIAAHAVGDEQAVALGTATTAFVIAVVAATRVRRSALTRKIKRRAYAFLAVAAAWLTGVTATELTL